MTAAFDFFQDVQTYTYTADIPIRDVCFGWTFDDEQMFLEDFTTTTGTYNLRKPLSLSKYALSDATAASILRPNYHTYADALDYDVYMN